MAVLTASDAELKKQLQKKLELLRLKKRMEICLPHLYGHKHYKWSKQFFDSTNKYTFLTSANQVGKSSVQIRKMIHWASAPDLWPRLWKTRPLQFWYLYPSKEVATIEFEKKWKAEFLPREEFQNHPQYGWRPEFRNKNIFAIHFNTGVSIYFKTYGTDVQNLQTGTCHYLAYDEELPPELYPELVFRISATDGYMSGVFTPTLNSKFWYEVMEVRGKNEKLPTANKIQVSLYDCKYYDDGSPSPWTDKRIAERVASCGSETEVQRRIMGRFVSEEGLVYSSFDRNKNIDEPSKVPPDWLWYSGIDVGSSGKSGHLAAICFVAVNPLYTEARVIEVWRADRSKNTTSTDILEKYLEMRGNRRMTGEFYDWGSAEFGIVAQRAGVPVQKAEKGKDHGVNLINSLFRNEMLTIDQTEPNQDLIDELLSLRVNKAKRHAADDAIDSLRYCIGKIPFDFSAVSAPYLKVPKVEQTKPKLYRGHWEETFDFDESDRQIEEMNDFYGE